jgi:coproporphyrinogen III oxidase
MSMPPQANWVYDFIPAPGSQEERTIQLLKKDINWIS